MTRALACFTAFVLGCSVGSVTPAEFEEEFGAPPEKAAAPDINIFSQAGMNKCISRLRAAVGETDVRATELILYWTTVTLTARSPTYGDRVRSYQCRHGEVGPSSAVTLTDSQVRSLDEDTFGFSEVDLDGLPALLRHTLDDLGLEHGRVASVAIHKEIEGVRVRVTVKGKQGDRIVEYDGRGRMVAR